MPTLPPTLLRAPTHDTLAAGTGAGAACLCPSLPRPRGSAGAEPFDAAAVGAGVLLGGGCAGAHPGTACVPATAP